jgi:hypothetical protein
MSETTGWVIFAIIGAAILSAVWVQWRARWREVSVSTMPAEQTPLSLSRPPTDIWRMLSTILQRRPLVIALAALGLAAVAQYVLVQGQSSLALVGYGVAAVLFAVSLREDVPKDFVESAPIAPPAAEAAPRAGGPAAHSPAPALPQAAPSFFRHWRYYTVADLLKGRAPDLPAPPAAPEPLAVPEPLEALTLPAVDLPAIEPAPPAPALAPALSMSAPAASSILPADVATWTGNSTPFVKPQSLLVTPQGHVIVLDKGQNLIYQLDPAGNVCGRWEVASMPAMRTNTMAVSPDGNTLYIADPQKRCIHVIRMGVRAG